MLGMVLFLLLLCVKYAWMAFPTSNACISCIFVYMWLITIYCKQIDDDLVPPWLLTQVLIGMAKFLPKQKLVPQKDLADLAFREAKKREQVCVLPFR